MNYLEIRKRADKSGPEPDFDKGESWPLAGVELVSGPPEDHELSDTFVTDGVTLGWIDMTRGQIVMHFTNHDDVVYDILEGPGRYADPDAPGGYRVEHRFLLKLASPSKRRKGA